MKFFNTKNKLLSKLIAGVLVLTAFLPTVQAVKPKPKPEPQTANEYLVDAVRSGSIMLAYLALKNGATNVNDALWELCEYKYKGEINTVGMAEFLLERGADVNARDEYDRTLLQVLCDHRPSDYRLVEFLIEHGADVNVCDCYGVTPLMCACRAGAKDTAEILLNHGARINERSQYGDTALIYAAYYNNGDTVGVVKLLLECGASVNLCTYDKKRSAVYYAVDNVLHLDKNSPEDVDQAKEVLRLLIEAGAK